MAILLDGLSNNEQIFNDAGFFSNSNSFKKARVFPVSTISSIIITSFPSIAQASRQTGVNATNIWQCANGYSSYSHAGGYKWRYTREFTNIENARKVNYNYTTIAYKNNKKKYVENRTEKRRKNRENKLKNIKLIIKLN